MNSIVRAFASKTKYYQKKKMILLNPNRDIPTTRLIYAKSNTVSDKIMQYDKLFKVCRIENIFINDFLYLIDESVSIVNINHVIDNSPIDYNLAVNCSITYIVERASENPIKKCNKIFLGIVQNYINRIIDYISNNENIPDIERHKNIFSNMLSRPADNLHDALQRILFWNQILWQTGHYLNGLGRLV